MYSFQVVQAMKVIHYAIINVPLKNIALPEKKVTYDLKT